MAEVVLVRTMVLVTVITLPPERVVNDTELPLGALEPEPESPVDDAEAELSGGGMSTIAMLSRPTYALPAQVILNVAVAESSSYVAR
jgi:hypothetical protein